MSILSYSLQTIGDIFSLRHREIIWGNTLWLGLVGFTIWWLVGDPAICYRPPKCHYRYTFWGHFVFQEESSKILVAWRGRHNNRLPWHLAPRGLGMRWWSWHSVCQLSLISSPVFSSLALVPTPPWFLAFFY